MRAGAAWHRSCRNMIACLPAILRLQWHQLGSLMFIGFQADRRPNEIRAYRSTLLLKLVVLASTPACVQAFSLSLCPQGHREPQAQSPALAAILLLKAQLFLNCGEFALHRCVCAFELTDLSISLFYDFMQPLNRGKGNALCINLIDAFVIGA